MVLSFGIAFQSHLKSPMSMGVSGFSPKQRSCVFCVSLFCQGSLNGTHSEGIKQYKSMTIFSDFPSYNALFGLVTNDPCLSWPPEASVNKSEVFPMLSRRDPTARLTLTARRAASGVGIVRVHFGIEFKDRFPSDQKL